MTLTNSKTDGMAYAITGKKESDGKQLAVKGAQSLSTPRLIWILAVRHKVAILAVGNVVLVLNWAFPAWFDVLRSLFK